MNDFSKDHDLIVTHLECLFLCTKNDENIGNKLKEILSVHVRFKEPKSKTTTASPKVILVHVDHFNEVSPKLYGIPIFIYFTKSLLSHAKYKMCESTLQQIYQDPERHCMLVPVFKKDEDRSEQGIPAYLCSMTSVILDDLMKDCTFDTVDEHSLSKVSFKKGVIRRFEQMFSNNYSSLDILNVEKLTDMRKILNNEVVNQVEVDANKLEGPIIPGREISYSAKNVLPANIIIINTKSPKSEDEKSDDGCPLYVIVDDDDDEDLESIEDEEGQASIKEVLSSARDPKSTTLQCMEPPSNSRDINLPDPSRIDKDRPVGKVVPFRRSAEAQEIDQTHPKEHLPGLSRTN